MFKGSYQCHLNSNDVFCPDLPLISRKPNGGTMAMWHHHLDPYIRVLPCPSSAVLPILLAVPGLSQSAHISVYLPTAGKDTEFLCALAALDTCIEQIKEDFSCPVYIRGDFNVNPKNFNRAKIFETFCSNHSLSSLDLSHPTHHHFTGEGASDSQLDLILYLGPPGHADTLSTILCSLTNPLVESHHDLIISKFVSGRENIVPCPNLISAPRIPNDRVKVRWDQASIPSYEGLVAPCLASIRESCSGPLGAASFDILLSSTYDALNLSAQATNKVLKLGKPHVAHPTLHPEVRRAQQASLRAASDLKHALHPGATLAARKELSEAKAELRRTTRAAKRDEAVVRDTRLASILSSNPRALYSFIRGSKSGEVREVQTLKVGQKIYTGSNVPDGFYDSLSSLKAPDMSGITNSDSFKQYSSDYEHIIQICQAGIKIPNLSLDDASTLLRSLKPDVNDLNSVTPAHFINAGGEGFVHFAFLINCIIDNINLSSLDSLNSVWAMVLFKGHGKERESDRSYRTISTCPLLSKALDKHVGSLFESGWAAAQASTQFQGCGSSHELAALLLTETVQHSLHVIKQPVYVLLLDAQSAFDRILRELCIRAAFLAGSHGQGLIFLDNRLKNRITFVEWAKVLMGPIDDKLGVEQGGILSDRLYKLANNAELTLTQDSGLGAHLGPVHVASIGQADDVALVSNSPHKLQALLSLALEYAAKYHIKMVEEKTKLLCFSPPGFEQIKAYWEIVLPISMSGFCIPFSTEAEHVGILRSSSSGVTAAVLARMTAHSRALFAVLPAGLARRHSGNPAAALRVELLYGQPVLLSGLAAMVLGKSDIEALDHHHKLKLEGLLRLYPGTPRPFVYFLAGCLPASAVLHLRQLTLLAMVAQLGPSCPLHQYGTYILSNPPPRTRSSTALPWFIQMRHLCQKYDLPDPSVVLRSPPSKATWKSETKKKVEQFWRSKLLAHVATLPSLSHLRASHMSLVSPSPLLTSCGSSGFEAKKMLVQIRMLSGRYRTCFFRRHWSGDASGSCRVPGCKPDTPGTLEHIATGQCIGLSPVTNSAISHWITYASSRPHLLPILLSYAKGSPAVFLSFLLDPSTQASSISLSQLYGHTVIPDLCMLTRTWLYIHHRARYRALGLWSAL